MADFLTTQGTSYYLENIIINANKWLVLISPFLNITENFLLRLQDADKRKVKIIIIYGKNELKPEEKKKLQELKNLSLHFCKNLHAKCYFNEQYMVITSLNLHDFSAQNNREMGILVTRRDDEEVFKQAVQEAQRIVSSASPQDLHHRTDEQLPTHIKNRVKMSGIITIQEGNTVKSCILSPNSEELNEIEIILKDIIKN